MATSFGIRITTIQAISLGGGNCIVNPCRARIPGGLLHFRDLATGDDKLATVAIAGRRA